MTRALNIGDFNSEKYWRDNSLAELPSIEFKNSAVILAMDELLFPFCKKDDVLITRFAFDGVLKDYLKTIGFEFKCNTHDFHTEKGDSHKTIFEIISRDESKFKDFLKAIEGCTYFSPYSITPWYDFLRKKAGFRQTSPAYEAVKRVNSKAYSTMLNKRLGLSSHSEIVNSGYELLEKGKEYLKKGNFLIKDTYGVSGKGNLLISSMRIFERIVKHIISSESKGKVCSFVIEKLLDKEIDFSCSFVIGEDGKIEAWSIQKIINHGFMYLGSESADPKLISFLRKEKYFEIINRISNEIYKKGYFGEVCVDSMILKSGDIVPVVEINARKSMGQINSKIDSYLCKSGLKGSLMHISLGVPYNLAFEDILAKLKDKKILYLNGEQPGVIPISSNTIFINKRLGPNKTEPELHSGRMYFSAAARDIFEKEEILKMLVRSLEELSCRIYSKV